MFVFSHGNTLDMYESRLSTLFCRPCREINWYIN